MKSINTHLAVQVSADQWLVTYVTDLGFAEVRLLSSQEFIEMIRLEARYVH